MVSKGDTQMTYDVENHLASVNGTSSQHSFYPLQRFQNNIDHKEIDDDGS